MKESTKMDFPARRVAQLEDIGDLAEILFPGNRSQQYAAACILFELKWADAPVPNLSAMEFRYSITRRTLQRTRTKLARFGLIEHISSLNARYGGQSGWKLSTRFASALRQLADKVQVWAETKTPGRRVKEEMLLEVLRPPQKPSG
ncbi:MAG: hypothetical protein WCI73_13035 [Phycisphaerae bacterium]